MQSKLALGHYVVNPNAESYGYWRLLYQGWYAKDLRSEEVDDAFHYTLPRFMDFVARLMIKNPDIASEDVGPLFRGFSRLATKEFKRMIFRQTRGECRLEGDVAYVSGESEPDPTQEEMQRALQELTYDELELIQTSILNSAFYRKGFYRKLAKIYGVSPDKIRAQYRKVLTKLRRILKKQNKIGCSAASDREPETQ